MIWGYHYFRNHPHGACGMKQNSLLCWLFVSKLQWQPSKKKTNSASIHLQGNQHDLLKINEWKMIHFLSVATKIDKNMFFFQGVMGYLLLVSGFLYGISLGFFRSQRTISHHLWQTLSFIRWFRSFFSKCRGFWSVLESRIWHRMIIIIIIIIVLCYPITLKHKRIDLWNLQTPFFAGSSINLGLRQKLSLLKWPTQNFRLLRNCCHRESRTCCEKCVWTAVTKWESPYIATSTWAVIKTLCDILFLCLVNRDPYKGLFFNPI